MARDAETRHERFDTRQRPDRAVRDRGKGPPGMDARRRGTRCVRPKDRPANGISLPIRAAWPAAGAPRPRRRRDPAS
jgi:hypothetical protein